MSEIVLNHLKDMGVSFLKRTTLVSINLTRKGKLLTNFVSEELVEDNPTLVKEEEFDTVVFAIGKQTNLDLLNLKNADIKFDSVENKIPTNDQDQTSVSLRLTNACFVGGKNYFSRESVLKNISL